ncbi:hypothetical protein ACLOJK_031514, partial [Asimina triloba]
MSSDFFEIVLPNPVLSEDVAGLADLRPRESAKGSGSLPLAITGEDDCLRGGFAGPAASAFERAVRALPGRDLPAEIGRSGKVVLRFGGASSGKSGGTIGCGGARGRGPGEAGRDAGTELLLFMGGARPTEDERPVTGDEAGVTVRRVGVDGRELDRTTGEVKFAGICGWLVGVEDLRLGEGRIFSLVVVTDGRVLAGVDDRTGVGRVVMDEDLAAEGRVERLLGVDGLEEVTDAELVLRTEDLL